MKRALDTSLPLELAPFEVSLVDASVPASSTTSPKRQRTDDIQPQRLRATLVNIVNGAEVDGEVSGAEMGSCSYEEENDLIQV